MQTFHSRTHRAELSEKGILEVFLEARKKIKETSFNGKKVTVTEHSAKDGSPMLKELLTNMDNSPVFIIAFAGHGTFHIDVEMGMQRWKGYNTTSEVQKRLEKYTFDPKDIKIMLKECKKTEHKHLAQVV
jgi:hypothetical protein